MKWIVHISNKISGFKIGASNGIYKVKVDTSLKNSNNINSSTY
jgi:hypothetical protein